MNKRAKEAGKEVKKRARAKKKIIFLHVIVYSWIVATSTLNTILLISLAYAHLYIYLFFTYFCLGLSIAYMHDCTLKSLFFPVHLLLFFFFYKSVSTFQLKSYVDIQVTARYFLLAVFTLKKIHNYFNALSF